MAEIIEELIVKISSDQKQFTQDMKGLQAEVKNLTGTADKASKSFGGFAGTLNLAKGILAGLGIAGGIQAIGNSMKAAAVESIQFQKAIAEINSILPANGRLTTATTNAIRDLSSEFGTSQREQAKSFYQIVSAGVSGTAKQMELLRVANKAAVAGLTSTTTAINGLTSVLAVFQSRGLDATTASDVLFASVREGKTTFGELANNIGKVSAIAASAELSFDELSGSLSFLTKSGLSTEEATTSFKGLLTSLIKPTEEAKKVMNELGLDLSVNAIRTKGFATVMEELRTATGGNIETLAKIIPNITALTAATQIAQGDFADFKRILGATANTTDDTSKAFSILSETADFKLDRAKSQITQLGTSLTDNLLPALGAAADGLSEIITRSNMLDKAMATLQQPTKTAGDEVLKLEAKLAILEDRMKTISESPFNIFGREDEMKEQQARIDKVRDQLGAAEEQAFKESANRNKKHLEVVAADNAEFNKKKLEELARVQSAQAEFDAIQAESAKAEKEERLNILADLVSGDIEKDQSDLERLQEKKEQELEIIKEAQENETISAVEAETARKTSLAQFSEDKKEIDRKSAKEKEDIEKKTGEQRIADQRATFDTIATLSSSSNKTLAALGKAAAITTATQDGIVAVQKALSAFPPPFNFAAAAAVGVATGANIAKIAGLKGGIDSIPGVGTADQFPALLAPGERVVPAKTNQDLTQFLSGGGGGQTISLSIVVNDAFGVNTDELGDRIIESINSASERSGAKIFRTALT